MMTLTTLLVFAGALFIAAGTPGPSVAALVARVISKGARDVLPFLFGMWAGDAIWLTCAIAGLSAIAESFYHVFVVIKWLGVLYLLYLAWRMWFAKADVEEEELPQERSRGRMYPAAMRIRVFAHGRCHQPRQIHGAVDPSLPPRLANALGDSSAVSFLTLKVK